MVGAQDDPLQIGFHPLYVQLHQLLFLGRKALHAVEHGQHFRRIGSDGEDQAFAGDLVLFGAAAVELPGHPVQRADVIGVDCRSLGQRVGVRHRQPAGNGPFFGYQHFDVFAFLGGDQVQQHQNRPHQRDHQHQHHCAQRRQHAAQQIAADIS